MNDDFFFFSKFIGSCMLMHVLLSLCSFVCPLGSVIDLVVSGDGAQLGLVAISGGFKAAASRNHHWVVASPAA